LYRSILETVLSIAETLLGCKALSLLSVECNYSIANLLLVLDPNPVSDPTLEEVRCGLCHMVTESQRLDWQEMKIAASPVSESIIAEFLEEGRYSGRDSPETVDDNWKDSNGDSIMTDLTQSTISGTDYRLFSDIERRRILLIFVHRGILEIHEFAEERIRSCVPSNCRRLPQYL
jgi:hypothetical protein